MKLSWKRMEKQHSILVLLTLSLYILFCSISSVSQTEQQTTMTKDFPTDKPDVTKLLTQCFRIN